MVQGETDEKARNIEVRSFVVRNMVKASQRKQKKEWDIEKPKLDHARTLRGIYFFDPEDEELKETMKNTQKKLEVFM